jgi:hypothetical protein
MKHNNFVARQRMLFVATALATLGSVVVATTSFAQTSTGCRAYAEDYAERYSAGSRLGDAFRVRRRHSAASAMTASTARRLRKSTLINNAYARCMQNRWP